VKLSSKGLGKQLATVKTVTIAVQQQEDDQKIESEDDILTR
jgi:hypothetical protein